MNKKRIFIFLGALLLMTGCSDFFMICSLNPFYRDQDVTLVPEMEGRWSVSPERPKSNNKDENDVWKQVDTLSVWKIERRIAKESYKTKSGKDSVVYKAQNSYTIKMMGSRADSALYKFRLVFFHVNKVIYADFMPVENTGLEKSRIASESYFRIHTLARVVIKNHRPEISWLGAEYMKGMIENKRVRVNYRWISDAGRLLLTGSSDQLYGMIARYAGETRFIDWENQPAMLKLNQIN